MIELAVERSLSLGVQLNADLVERDADTQGELHQGPYRGMCWGMGNEVVFKPVDNFDHFIEGI